jgi:hypothetical protein
MLMIAGAKGSGTTTFASFLYKIHVLTVGRVSDSVTRQKTLQPTSTPAYAPLTRPTWLRGNNINTIPGGNGGATGSISGFLLHFSMLTITAAQNRVKLWVEQDE